MNIPAEIGMQAWRDYQTGHEPTKLIAMLADNAVFHSPVVHTPQVGKQIVFAYLDAAAHVFVDSNFRYVDEIRNENSVMMEFEAKLDNIHINGVDIIHFNDQGQIIKFKVMVRPLKAVNKLWEHMGAMLEKAKKT